LLPNHIEAGDASASGRCVADETIAVQQFSPRAKLGDHRGAVLHHCAALVVTLR
jgi:hypothetical protein